MSLNYEMARYTELTGEDGTKVSVSRLGGFFDGYEKGRADAIDEFKQALKQELNKYDFWIYDIADSDGYTLETSCNRDFLIDEVAEQLKENKE